MFDFYKSKDEKFQDVFILNNKITKKLIKRNILKMADLYNYVLPSSKEEIIPQIEKISGGAKLLTDVIAETLDVESFLKINSNISPNLFIGEDFIIVEKTFFTTNPLSQYIRTLEKNIKHYDEDEVMFNKIGYINSFDLDKIKNQKNKSSDFLNDETLSKLKIDNIFFEILNNAITKKASSLKIFFRNNSMRALFSINFQSYEVEVLSSSIDNYIKLINYLDSVFEKGVIHREISNKKYKLSLSSNKATESQIEIKVLDIKISNLDAPVKELRNVLNLHLKDSKACSRALSSPYGLFVVSSKKHLKENLYSVIKQQFDLNKNSKIYSIEKYIERDFDYIIQLEVANFDTWKTANFDNYNVIIVDEIKTAEEVNFILDLATNGKKVIIGYKSNNAIESLSKIYNLSNNKEVLSENLLGILQMEKVHEVCPHCSTKIMLFKDENFQDFSALENIPVLMKNIRKENKKGCDKCYQGYNGMIDVAEYLDNNEITKSNILNDFNIFNIKIEKNSDSWFNIYENSLDLLNDERTTTHSIINNLGFPRKL